MAKKSYFASFFVGSQVPQSSEKVSGCGICAATIALNCAPKGQLPFPFCGIFRMKNADNEHLKIGHGGHQLLFCSEIRQK